MKLTCPQACHHDSPGYHNNRKNHQVLSEVTSDTLKLVNLMKEMLDSRVVDEVDGVEDLVGWGSCGQS
jgi:hypothetical protein